MTTIYIINSTTISTGITYEKYYYNKADYMKVRRNLNSNDNRKINRAMGCKKYTTIKLLDHSTNQMTETLLKVIPESSELNVDEVVKGYQEQYRNNSYVKVIVK